MNEKQLVFIHYSALCSFRYFARFNAVGANSDTFYAALWTRSPDGLQIGIEAASRAVICMRNIVAELRAFAADFTFLSHDDSFVTSFEMNPVFRVANDR